MVDAVLLAGARGGRNKRHSRRNALLLTQLSTLQRQRPEQQFRHVFLSCKFDAGEPNYIQAKWHDQDDDGKTIRLSEPLDADFFSAKCFVRFAADVQLQL